MRLPARLLFCAFGIAVANGCGAQAARGLLEQAAEAMGGLERLRGLDNVVLTGFGVYLSQQGGGNLSPDAHAPSKWQEGNAARRVFDLKGKRALYQDRRISMFPFAAASGNRWSETLQVQTGVQALDHPLTALLAALEPGARLGPVRTENDLAVVELTVADGAMLWIALDARAHLPAWVRWVNGSATLGDVTSTAYFTGYLPFDGVELPTGFKTMIDWRDTTTSEFQVDSYRLNVRDLEPFPATITNSPPGATALAVKPVAKGVWDVRYGGNAGAVVEFADHLTMFEAYGSELATFARLDAANKLVKGKQVTEVIVSHHHFDHSGGLRAAVSRGLTIISRRANEGIFREMVARPAPNFPDALARNPQPMKFVPVDEHLVLEDKTMRVDVYHAVGHLHMADAVFAYVPSVRVLMEGDFTTFDWDYNWWGGAYLDNVARYKLDPAINVPVHGKVTTFAETTADIERQVANARKFCTDNAAAAIFTAGCPVPGK
ncbi:MAG TPA: MBL fold metallo-hydrolase [Gammaproteobacteria bacterium]|nr:MBL fold metallo-hydrolase [Gammaproteobacteria bacterium]